MLVSRKALGPQWCAKSRHSLCEGSVDDGGRKAQELTESSYGWCLDSKQKAALGEANKVGRG